LPHFLLQDNPHVPPRLLTNLSCFRVTLTLSGLFCLRCLIFVVFVFSRFAPLFFLSLECRLFHSTLPTPGVWGEGNRPNCKVVRTNRLVWPPPPPPPSPPGWKTTDAAQQYLQTNPPPTPIFPLFWKRGIAPPRNQSSKNNHCQHCSIFTQPWWSPWRTKTHFGVPLN